MTKIVALIGLWITTLCAADTSTSSIQAQHTTNQKAKIQVALILDTSGSMDGLLEQAKSQLWKMVNELATSKKNGLTPSIELALYEYGKSTIVATEGYIKQLVPLSSDLDLVSEQLFALKTNGGDEYCGWAIKDATKELKWSDSNDDLKIIIIAGNEIFTQGSVDYRKACQSAISQGIVVNTIYCGDCTEGIRYLWKDAADLADGQYMCINQNDQVAHIETPFDAEIGQLNKVLNETYIAYGKVGESRKQRQLSQDTNAGNYGASNIAERAVSKSKKATYNNASWDMVDALEDNESLLEEIEISALPQVMKSMDLEERKKFVAKKAKERVDIQQKIQEVAEQRKAFISKKRKETSSNKSNTLDEVMLKTVREQALSKSFKFEVQ